jgi:Major Facilitator Superfamily
MAGIISAFTYIRHARRVDAPVLRLSLLEKPIFRVALTSSALFRVGAGSMPFLLPLMLQLSFGMNPFQSGMITFVSVIGAISVKLAAASTFARYGFRTALLVNALATSATLLAMAGLTKETPLILIYILLFSTGFTRSLFYTGLNALSYSEIEPPDMAQATALNASVQQLSHRRRDPRGVELCYRRPDHHRLPRGLRRRQPVHRPWRCADCAYACGQRRGRVRACG